MEVRFEADDGTVTKVEFSDGGFVKRGQALLEYKNNDGVKKKLACPEDGVVAYAGPIKPNAQLNKGTLIATIGVCCHPIVLKDLCCTCGKELREKDGRAGQRIEDAEANVSMVHHVPELHVSKTLAKELGDRDQERLLQNRKLVLLVDLDQTVIHTSNMQYGVGSEKTSELVTYRINSGTYTTKIRPYTMEFLKNMSELYEMHIVTMGQRQYAHKIAEVLDPTRSFFRERIVSRDELFSQQFKTANLKALFPSGQQMIVIIDDRSDVWQHSEALIQVKPYRYFPDVGDINAPAGTRDDPSRNILDDLPDDDQTLQHIEKVLKHVHENFYVHHDRTKNIRDVKVVISYLKKQVLRGLVIVLSGVVPLGTPVETSELYRLCLQFGARVEQTVTDETTHLVAARWGTDKVHAATKRGTVKIVNPKWLSACMETWEKPDESAYPLEKEISSGDKDKKKEARSKKVAAKKEEVPSTSVKQPDHEVIHITLDEKTFADMENEVDEALSDEENDEDGPAGVENRGEGALKRSREWEDEYGVQDDDDGDEVAAKRVRADEEENVVEYEDNEDEEAEQTDYADDADKNSESEGDYDAAGVEGDAEDAEADADIDEDADDEDDEMAAMLERQISDD